VSRPQLKSLNGELFCGCKEGYRYSEEQNKVLVDRKSSQLRMEHIFTEEVKASSKIKYRCLCKGNDYKSCTVRSFLKKKGNGCKYCERGDKSCMGKVSSILMELEGKGNYCNFKYEPIRKCYTFKCKVCENDEFSKQGLCEGVFSSNLGNLRKGAKPCRCGTNHRHTEDQYLYMCRKASEQGFSVKGVYGDFKGRETEIQYTCPKGKINKATVNNYLGGKRCKCCSLTGFNPEKDGNLYIVKWKTEKDLQFIKIGITNLDVKGRIKEQWRKSGSIYTYEILSVIESSGFEVQRLEGVIKSKLPCKYVSKDLFPDGYTETLPLNCLDKVLGIVEEN
jgi:hypothetical protein